MGAAAMTIAITSGEYEAFSRFLEQECGIVLGENKQYLIANRLSALCQERKIVTLGVLLDKLHAESTPSLRERVVDAMTTNETQWFRDQYPFEYLKRIILPDLARFF